MITFYDEDDKALDNSTVDRIYSGFSQALSRELSIGDGQQELAP